MSTNCKNDLWVILIVQEKLFAITAADVQSMVAMPEITGLPEAPDYVRGVINLRGQVIPLIDLRRRLGMPSLVDEVNGMLDKREQDHKKWLNELELCVKEKRAFKLATDPHKCAFGKWYDAYYTNNIVVSNVLKKFAAPHKAIHSIASKVDGFIANSDVQSANDLINVTRGKELSEMIRLFAELKEAFARERQEIAVVMTVNSSTFAIAVDSIDSVAKLLDDSIEDMDNVGLQTAEKELILGIGRQAGNNKTVVILNSALIRK